ncbi:hypothetical protein [Paraburkholderia caribensis]|uniref:hypothetical protein n=1 Tax=Paraburkholderia caribensis TaxID=75105 RepID=UPI0034D154E8
MNKVRLLLLGLPITLSVLAACGIIPGSSRDDQFCSELSSVMRTAPSKFESIKAQPRRDDSWNSKISFTGMKECSIEKIGTVINYYTCEAFESADKQTVENAAQKLKQRVQSCLGESWEPRTRQRDDGPSVSFRQGDNPTYVSLRMRRNIYDSYYLLKIDVNSD